MQTRLAVVAFSLATVALTPVAALAQAPAPAEAPVSSKIWLDRRGDFEEYLKTAEVVGMEELKVGVTKPRPVTDAPQG